MPTPCAHPCRYIHPQVQGALPGCMPLLTNAKLCSVWIMQHRLAGSFLPHHERKLPSAKALCNIAMALAAM